MTQEKKAAFQQIYAENSRDLYTFLLRSLRDEPSARDLLQDAFLNFMRAFEHRDLPENSACRMYLFRTARNLTINLVRSSRYRKDVALVETTSNDPSPEDAMLRGIACEIREESLQELLASLDERDSSIIQMRYAHDMKLEEIASVIGISASSVSRRIDRARSALLQILKKKEHA